MIELVKYGNDAMQTIQEYYFYPAEMSRCLPTLSTDIYKTA